MDYSIFFLVVIIVLFVVMTIIPQRRRQKKMSEMMDSIKLGDLVRTIGGVHGKVVAMREEYVTIETGTKGTEIEFLKQAIAGVEPAYVREKTEEENESSDLSE